jgi:putative transposase
MTRPLRIEYPGALYHVMSRGNAYQDIYLDDDDRRAFLKNLKHCINLHNLVCHAYCLMDNHYHLLIETPDGNLSQAMRDVNGNYTQRFNIKHKRVGHVLQGRYKAYIIEKDIYLHEVVRYIVNNPVKANIVEHPKEWKWSSYKATDGSVKAPHWLETDFTLGLFSDKRKDAQKLYRAFVMEDTERESPYEEVKEGVILGSQQFIDWIWETQTNGSEEIKEISRSQRVVGRPTLEEIFEEKMTKEQRDIAIKFARFRCGYLTTEIAKYVGLNRSVVGRISRGTYNSP